MRDSVWFEFVFINVLSITQNEVRSKAPRVALARFITGITVVGARPYRADFLLEGINFKRFLTHLFDFSIDWMDLLDFSYSSLSNIVSTECIHRSISEKGERMRLSTTESFNFEIIEEFHASGFEVDIVMILLWFI